MKRTSLTNLVGKEIKITDFYIKKSMKSKLDTANVEFELDGKEYFFTTTSPYIIYQLTWIKQCILDYNLNKRTKGIKLVQMIGSDPSLQNAVTKVLDKGNKVLDNRYRSYVIFSDDTCDAKNRDNPYLVFYKNSIYVKIIKQKNRIYFSFTLSKNMISKLKKEESDEYNKKTKEMLSKGDIKYKYISE